MPTSPRKKTSRPSQAVAPLATPVIDDQKHSGSAEKQYPIGVVVRQTNVAFRNSLNEQLKQHKVTPAQWVFLRILWNEDVLNQKDLAERVGVHPTTAGPAISILERNGYVSRDRTGADRRHITVRLTERGHQLARTLLPLALEQNRKSLRGISNQDAEKLLALLLQMQRNLAADD